MCYAIRSRCHTKSFFKLPEKIKNVFTIAEDKEGNVWIGTDRGLKRLETDGVRIRVEGNIERENGLEEAPVIASVAVNPENLPLSFA